RPPPRSTLFPYTTLFRSLAALKVENTEKCEPPLLESEVAGIAKSAAGYPAGPAIAVDVGLVKHLADAIKSEGHFAQDSGGRLYRSEEHTSELQSRSDLVC